MPRCWPIWTCMHLSWSSWQPKIEYWRHPCLGEQCLGGTLGDGNIPVPANYANIMLGTFTCILLMPQMRLPTPIFSSMLSSALCIFCQSTERVFSPIRVNRRLPPAGLLVLLGRQTATLMQKGSQLLLKPSQGLGNEGKWAPKSGVCS